MDSVAATMRLYERASPAERWRALGSSEPANIGKGGMGWSQFYLRLARRGEPVKVEGDKRAPAGIFPIGRSFGILASNRPDYLHITADTICVNDPSSPAYNTIASRARLGPAVRAEHMSRVLPMYRRGLRPTRGAGPARASSFMSGVRRPPGPPAASRFRSRGSRCFRILPRTAR
jgi:L,D-peptidoglycan transpeptidase YkuD (ErfK/YbiS/YcfS/YnhG family)